MSPVTQEQFETLVRKIDALQDGQREMRTDIKVLENRVNALPDKQAIYTASIAIHGLVWGTIISTIMLLNTFGAFK